jgi:hypothetical protein
VASLCVGCVEAGRRANRPAPELAGFHHTYRRGFINRFDTGGFRAATFFAMTPVLREALDHRLLASTASGVVRGLSGSESGESYRNEEERRNVAGQVAVLVRVNQGLHRHDAPVNDTGPDREPDETRVGLWIASGEQEEDAEGGVDADHHQLVFVLPG